MVLSLTPKRVARLAVREYLAQPRLQVLCSRLESAKSNLAICFMVYTISQGHRSSPKVHYDEPDCSTEIEQEIQCIKYIWESQPALMKELNDLCTMMDVTSTIDTKSTDMKPFVDQHRTQVDLVFQRLDTKFQNESITLRELTRSIEALHIDADQQKEARALMLASLEFPEMNDRMLNIKRAHAKTFQWMFGSCATSSHNWNNFIEWLYSMDQEPVYWIQGKAGSGKSTLVREVYEVLSSDYINRSWQPSCPTNIANCFFWNAGTTLQRSQKGLLQNLAHQIFVQQPHLIFESIPPGRRDYTRRMEVKEPLWTTKELKQVLRNCVTYMKNDTALLILVDGLDEFDGNDEERLEMIDFLISLTRTGWVKLCVSSRPWNIYKTAFEDFPGLRLEDLTRSDIERVVTSTLQGDKLLMRKLSKHPYLIHDLTAKITGYAEGVFLWVRLVLRDLLKANRDGCQPGQLPCILDNVPRDLNEYFGCMVRQMDPTYQQDAALILKVKLCDMSYKSLASNTLMDEPSLCLFDLLCLNDGSDGSYVTLESPDNISVNDLVDTLERRIASRSMGLLQVSYRNLHTKASLQSEVTYLHRTVKDFLCTPQAQKELDFLLDQPFNAIELRCESLLARINMVMTNSNLPIVATEDAFVSWLECFLYWAQSPELDQSKAIKMYQQASSAIAMFMTMKFMGSRCTFDQRDFNKMNKDNDLPLYFAIQYGWKAYAQFLTQNDHEDGKVTVDHLLDMALTAHMAPSFTFNLEMIKYILSLGANPNAEVPRRPLSTQVRCVRSNASTRRLPIWIQFLADLYYFQCVNDCPNLLEIIKTLLKANASHHIPLDQFTACSGTRPWFPSTIEPKSITDEPSKTVCCIQQCPDKQSNKTIHILEVLQRLRSAKHMTRPTGSVFNDQQLLEIEILCNQIDSDRVRSQPHSHRNWINLTDLRTIDAHSITVFIWIFVSIVQHLFSIICLYRVVFSQ